MPLSCRLEPEPAAAFRIAAGIGTEIFCLDFESQGLPAYGRAVFSGVPGCFWRLPVRSCWPGAGRRKCPARKIPCTGDGWAKASAGSCIEKPDVDVIVVAACIELDPAMADVDGIETVDDVTV